LWKNPFIHNYEKGLKLCDAIISLLPTSSKQLLFDNNIDIPLPIFSNQPLFNYISFSSKIPHDFINQMLTLIDGDERTVLFKRNLLEREVYKLFVDNCKNIKNFYWKTPQPLPQYQGALNCFSQLQTLNVDLRFVTSISLFEMAQICQKIENLEIWDCNGDVPGLIGLIDLQKNLRSLFLYFKNLVSQCVQTSEVIQRKAGTLKKLTVMPVFNSFSPKFLPSLINLEYLELGNNIYGDVIIEEWENYLSISALPKLQYLRFAFLSIHEEHTLIERSNGNLLEIEVYCNGYEHQDFVYTEKLIEAISKNCPKVEKLTFGVELENLNGIKKIFLNCTRLRKICLFTTNAESRTGDELLEILACYSSYSLYEISFNDNWNFSVKGLQTFFENWKVRVPLIFTIYYEYNHFGKDHKMLVRKYFDEGVIKETNCLQ